MKKIPPNKQAKSSENPQNYQFIFIAVKSRNLGMSQGSLIGLILYFTFLRDLENRLDR